MAVPFESEISKRGVVGIKCVLVMKGAMKGFWNYIFKKLAIHRMSFYSNLEVDGKPFR